MAPTEPPLKAAPMVAGLKIARYAAKIASQAVANALPGFENRRPQACRTVVLVNAISSAPTTRAATMARNVTTAGLPSTIALTRPVDAGRPGLSGLSWVATEGCCSVITAPLPARWDRTGRRRRPRYPRRPRPDREPRRRPPRPP